MTNPVDTSEDSRWYPLTVREKLRLLPIVQDVWFAATHWTGIRNRLRCPKCRAVGTWKMHGSLLERWLYKDIHTRRCLCKWCGYYIGPLGRTVAFPSTEHKVWRLPDPEVEREPTPAEVVRAHMGKTWPWHG